MIESTPNFPNLKETTTTTSRRLFTLVEILIAVCLIAMMAGVVGVRMSRGLEERRFQTGVARLRIELESARRLSMNMQADWILILEKRQNSLALQRSCPEVGQSALTEWEFEGDLFWNREKVDRITFHFASTGKNSPKGLLRIKKGSNSTEWKLPALFNQQE